MSEKTLKALLSAAASSAMEGMPLDNEKAGTAEKILCRGKPQVAFPAAGLLI